MVPMDLNILWIAGIVHICVCLLLFLGMKLRFLKVRQYLFFAALFLPLWGPLAVLLLSAQVASHKTDVKQVGIETFELESDLYKGIARDISRAAGATVSMEEALVVNSPRERRSLIMDVLNDNPKHYVDFLKKAGNNEDTEVVHYAVTAMVEMSKENDEMLWQLEKRYAQNQNDLVSLTQYTDFLWECLEQGLMQGQVERMNRSLFAELIRKKISMTAPNLQDYLHCVENALIVENFNEANGVLEEARARWPRNEDLLIMKIRWAAATQRGDVIKELLAEIERENIFLSGKSKEVIAFWKE